MEKVNLKHKTKLVMPGTIRETLKMDVLKGREYPAGKTMKPLIEREHIKTDFSPQI